MKNLEYLSSGRPLVAYKLDGIPNEYDDYIFYVKDNSTESLAGKIVEICEKPSELIQQHCNSTYVFVKEEKNEIKQTKRIVEMLNTERILD